MDGQLVVLYIASPSLKIEYTSTNLLDQSLTGERRNGLHSCSLTSLYEKYQ
ncbi:hypothetical protein ACS0TY_004133 [Phlomoides rotata]